MGCGASSGFAYLASRTTPTISKSLLLAGLENPKTLPSGSIPGKYRRTND